jgi:hypothetical protein
VYPAPGLDIDQPAVFEIESGDDQEFGRRLAVLMLGVLNPDAFLFLAPLTREANVFYTEGRCVLL